jgi:pimeloyl-ACP methyl ester carboxylesterase
VGPVQEIRVTQASDGARIAYAVAGDGPPLVKTANWLNHLEFDWESPVWRHLMRELSSRHTLVRYDERGNGLSDWAVDDISFEAFVRDLEAVVEASGLERFALLGISQGCAVAVAFAVRHPERVTRLVLQGGYAAGWRIRERRDSAEITSGHLELEAIRMGWGRDIPAYRQLFASIYMPGATPEQSRSWTELQRISASPENAARLLEAFGEIDVRDLLPQVRVPTLVLHSTQDGTT